MGLQYLLRNPARDTAGSLNDRRPLGEISFVFKQVGPSDLRSYRTADSFALIRAWRGLRHRRRSE